MIEDIEAEAMMLSMIDIKEEEAIEEEMDEIEEIEEQSNELKSNLYKVY